MVRRLSISYFGGWGLINTFYLPPVSLTQTHKDTLSLNKKNPRVMRLGLVYAILYKWIAPSYINSPFKFRFLSLLFAMLFVYLPALFMSLVTQIEALKNCSTNLPSVNFMMYFMAVCFCCCFVWQIYNHYLIMQTYSEKNSKYFYLLL